MNVDHYLNRFARRFLLSGEQKAALKPTQIRKLFASTLSTQLLLQKEAIARGNDHSIKTMDRVYTLDAANVEARVLSLKNQYKKVFGPQVLWSHTDPDSVFTEDADPITKRVMKKLDEVFTSSRGGPTKREHNDLQLVEITATGSDRCQRTGRPCTKRQHRGSAYCSDHCRGFADGVAFAKTTLADSRTAALTMGEPMLALCDIVPTVPTAAALDTPEQMPPAAAEF